MNIILIASSFYLHAAFILIIYNNMRISVDIDDEILKEVMSLTGEKSKSPALAKAVTEYVRGQKAKAFGRLIREGAFDYPDPQEQPATAEANPPPLW